MDPKLKISFSCFIIGALSKGLPSEAAIGSNDKSDCEPSFSTFGVAKRFVGVDDSAEAKKDRDVFCPSKLCESANIREIRGFDGSDVTADGEINDSGMREWTAFHEILTICRNSKQPL